MGFFDRMSSSSSESDNHDIWNDPSALEDVGSLLRKSKEKPQLIYKHSHRCSVCFLAKQEVEKVADQINDDAALYMINVIHQRDISNSIASELEVRHESPQVIILKDGEVAWKGSHWQIKGQDILDLLR